MSENSASLLRTEALSVRYGGVAANTDIDIAVDAGEIVGLIGPNGAGKTTFVDAVTGFTEATGKVTLGGDALNGLGPHRRRRAGLARTWQAGELFGDLTVAQNLAVALQPSGLRRLFTDLFGRSAPPGEAIDAALELAGVPGVADRRPDELTLGQQKLVGVARALVGGSRVVLLDEPAAGLDTHESREFGQHLRRVAASGIGVLLIDHDMSLVLDICTRLYVLDFGVVIASGEPAAVREDPRVISAYLGAAGAGDTEPAAPATTRPAGDNA
ncbi:ABC transporter ATP-binding protein [Nocardia takedensis]|uniref:ABC transporter ATP-binding protein n=1 Tax=Nocardia takedensis TaxID=259390 RepID=UPI0003044FE9|nr:ABC transporter ATP-binding protein [Nocardia takedensis]